MQPTFKTINEMKIVGVGGVFISVLSPDKNNMEVIPELWLKYMSQKDEIKNVLEKKNLGVCFEAPEGRRTRNDQCVYLAATEVTSFENVPTGMETLTIPAGEYAVFTHVGDLENFESTMKYIYGTWLPSSGKKLRNAPDIEWYDERFKLNQDDSEIDIYIPIE